MSTTTNPDTRSHLLALQDKVRQARSAYYRGEAEYEDMRDAARTYLEAKAKADRAAGRKAPRTISSGAIAGLLRAL